MEYYDAKEIQSVAELHKLVGELDEAFIVYGDDGTPIILQTEASYTSLLKRIAELDEVLQREVLVAIGDHALRWEDEAYTTEVANYVGVSLELFMQVAFRLERKYDDLFRSIDDEKVFFSPVGWEQYEYAKRDQLADEMLEIDKPQLLLIDGDNRLLLAMSEGLYRCIMPTGEPATPDDFNTLNEQLESGESVDSRFVDEWESLDLEDLERYWNQVNGIP